MMSCGIVDFFVCGFLALCGTVFRFVQFNSLCTFLMQFAWTMLAHSGLAINGFSSFSLFALVVCSSWTVNHFLFGIHCGLTTFPSFLSYQDPTWISLKWRERCITRRFQVFWQLAKFWQDEIVFRLEYWIFFFFFGVFVDIVDTWKENCWLSNGLNFTMKLFSGFAKFVSVPHTNAIK